MKFTPIKIDQSIPFLIFFALTLILGCSKDLDEPYDGLDTAMVKTNLQAKNLGAVISGTLPGGKLPSSGRAPFKVAFKAWNSKNQNKIKSYSWDFGDGSKTTGKNPSHTFTKAGKFKVKLTVKNAGGATDTATFDISVTGDSGNRDFAAVISGMNSSGLPPSSGRAPLKVDFKAWNSKNQKKITGYSWDFGDGNKTTKKNPLHTFSTPGQYKVKLTVKNAGGATDTATFDISVTGGSTNKGIKNLNYPSNAVMASSFGFKAGDATAAFEAAIKSGNSYVVIDKQSSDWVIRSTKFFDLRNMTIVFEPGVTLRAKSGGFREGNRLFELVRANNVTVEGSGATFKMNKNEYNSGEQRHAFGITNCNDITVRGLTLRDSGGSGIYIVGNGNYGYSQNITIENIRSLNNRRDGMTITSAQNVWVRNSVFSKSSGTMPESGVVLESDSPNERLVNINFVNCKFSDNNSAGFHFSTNKMNGGSRPVSVKVVDCEFSNNAVSPGRVPASEVIVGGGHGTNVVGGEIRFERAKFNGSRGRIVFSRKSGNGFRAVFKDCEARNVVSSTSASPISLEGSSDRNTTGGMVFDNFYIQYNRNVPFMHINAPSRNGSFDVKNISGSFRIKEPHNYRLKYSGGYQPGKNVNVSINYKHI